MEGSPFRPGKECHCDKAATEAQKRKFKPWEAEIAIQDNGHRFCDDPHCLWQDHLMRGRIDHGPRDSFCFPSDIEA